MAISCPHCQGPVLDSPALAGSDVQCPHCQGVFTMPGTLAVTGQLLPARTKPPAPQVTPIFINTVPRSQPRLESSGWFSRAFSTTSGVLVALVVFVVLICGGIFVAARLLPDVPGAPSRITGDAATAKRYAIEYLQRHGIAELSDSARAGYRDGEWVVSGTAIRTDRQIVKVQVVLAVVVSGTTLHWQVEGALIDGELAD